MYIKPPLTPKKPNMICTLMVFRFFEALKEAFVLKHKRTHRLRSKNTSTAKKYCFLYVRLCADLTPKAHSTFVSVAFHKKQTSFNPCLR